MADKKIDWMHHLKQGAVALGLVGAPAFGGQVLSAALKAKSDTVRDMSDGMMGETLVDGVSGLVVGAVEVGVAYLVGGSETAAKVLPLAVGGAAICASLPAVDRGIDKMVDALLGDDAPVVALPSSSNVKAFPAAASRASLALPAAAMKRTPGGSIRDVGVTLPGGANDIGVTLPGGDDRGNAAY